MSDIINKLLALLFTTPSIRSERNIIFVHISVMFAALLWAKK